MDLIHMTVQYSNAMLVAVMPHVSQFVARANLPLAQPVPLTAVTNVTISPYLQMPAMSLWLTNGWWFLWDHRGYISSWRSPDDWYFEQRPDINWTNYVGPNRMTTNDAIALARQTAVRLGYGRYAAEAPEVEGPYLVKPFGHTEEVNIPYCQVSWDWPKGAYWLDQGCVRFSVNLNTGRLVEMFFCFNRDRGDAFEADPLKLSVTPELEKDYRARRSRESK